MYLIKLSSAVKMAHVHRQIGLNFLRQAVFRFVVRFESVYVYM